MEIFNSTRFTSRVSKLSLVLLFLLLQVFVLPSTQQAAHADAIDDKVNAALINGSSSAESLLPVTYLYLLTRCSEINRPKNPISAEDLESYKFFNDNDEIDGGYAFGPDNGKIRCNQLVNLAKGSSLEIIGLSTATELRGYFYKNVGGVGNYVYQFANGGSPFPLVTNLMKNVIADNRDATLASAFSKCYKESDSGNLTVDGVKFADSASKPSGKAKVMLGITADGSNDYSCETVANLVEQGNIYDKMKELGIKTSDLRNSQFVYYLALKAQESQSEVIANGKADILAILSENSDIVEVCLTSAEVSLSVTNSQLAEWLASGNVEDLKWRNLHTTEFATQAQADNLQACLIGNDAFGEELAALLEEIGGDLEAARAILAGAVGGTDAENQTQEDQCLSADGFIGWVACPIISFIYEAADLFQTTVQELLEFSLSNKTSNNQTIKPVWNIFRSLATTILIVGFLLTLLIKTIRGE